MLSLQPQISIFKNTVWAPVAQALSVLSGIFGTEFLSHGYQEQDCQLSAASQRKTKPVEKLLLVSGDEFLRF